MFWNVLKCFQGLSVKLEHNATHVSSAFQVTGCVYQVVNCMQCPGLDLLILFAIIATTATMQHLLLDALACFMLALAMHALTPGLRLCHLLNMYSIFLTL
jgi:hypothetical protein